MSLDRGRPLLMSGVLVLLCVGGLSAQGQQQGGQGQNATSPPPQGTEFVYIDSQQLLQQAPGATEAQQTWQQEMSTFQTELQTLRTELDSLQRAYQQQRENLSPQQREQREQQIAEKRQQLQTRAQELEQKAAQRQQELLGPILDRVRSVIEEIRSERGYTMVFDANAAGLLAADPRLDITDLVVQALRGQSAGQPGGDAGAGGRAGGDRAAGDSSGTGGS